MILLVHILIALTSVGLATYAALRPTKRLVRSGYISVVATLISGIMLVVATPSSLTHACVSGFIFTSITLTLVSVSSYRLRSFSA